MSLLDTLRKGLKPELYDEVVDQLGDDFDYDLVPRTRLNKVIKQRNELRVQLAGGSQPPKSGQKKNVDEDDDDDATLNGGVDIEGLKKQFEAEQNKAIKGVKIQYAALDTLRKVEAIDPELLWSSSAIDKSKLDIDDNGKLTGLDDQIAELQKNKAHLFKKKEEPVPGGTGKKGGAEFEGVTTKDAFLKLEIDKQIAFKQAHPEMFKKFMSTI